jgi:signal peptidase I
MKKNKNVDNLFFGTSYLTGIVVKSFLIAILCVVGVSVLLFSCYYVDMFMNLKNGKNDSPLFGAYVIVSPSMVPTIDVNDAIVVKRVDNDKYNIGDIITFNSSDYKYNGLTVTHRIVNKVPAGINNSIYTTKGDNNPIVDPTEVQTNAIYGKVLFRIPKLGYFQNFLSKPSNFFICLLVPALIVLIFDGYKICFSFIRRSEI